MHHTVLIATFALLSLGRLAGHFTEPRLTSQEIHGVVGQLDIATAPPAGAPIKVVSWNIERGTQFERILETLRRLDADVLLLQEVDRFCSRSGGRDIAADLARALGMNWAAAGEFQEIGEGSSDAAALTGQAILSRYPINDVKTIVFPEQARFRWRFSPIEPRRGGRMALKARTAGMLVYSAHIESGGNETLRRKQVDSVVDDQMRNGRASEPVVIAGDFNNASVNRSPVFELIRSEGFTDSLGSGERRTSIHHEHAIDWVFVKNLVPQRGFVEVVDGASDHYPVFASLTTSTPLATQ